MNILITPSTVKMPASRMADPPMDVGRKNIPVSFRFIILSRAICTAVFAVITAIPALAAGEPGLSAAAGTVAPCAAADAAEPCVATGEAEPPAVSLAADADTYAADYETLMEWAFSSDSVPVPDGGITWQRDTASWTLDYGTLRYMRPMSDGTVTGLVFEGRGRFTMTIPDRVEARQLPRFTGGPASETLELTFTQMVLRTPEGLIHDHFPALPGDKTYVKHALARSRHLWWLKYARFDADARVTTGRLIPEDEYLAVDMNTAEHGWLFYEFDGQRMEEIRLCRMRETYNFVEVWLSLDRDEHRRPDGRPGSTKVDLIDVVHANLTIDLSEHTGRRSRMIAQRTWRGKRYPITRFSAAIEFLSCRDGLQALPLRLHPFARVTEIVDENGRELPWFRVHLGKKFLWNERDEHDTALMVLLRKPQSEGARFVITVTYERRTGNWGGNGYTGPEYKTEGSFFMGGGLDWYPNYDQRLWYPLPFESCNDLHTAHLTIVHPKNLQVRASGSPAGSKQKGRMSVSVWDQISPVRVVGFSYGRGHQERRIIREGQPEVVALGRNRIQRTNDSVNNTAMQIADGIYFFQDLFDTRLPWKSITCTQVDGGGAIYGDFISRGRTFFYMDRPYHSEGAVAGTAAMLFLGHMISWESYRDQWLRYALMSHSSEIFLEAVSSDWGMSRRGRYKDFDDYQSYYFRSLRKVTTYRIRKFGPPDVGYRARVPENFSEKAMFYDLARGYMTIRMLRCILDFNIRDGDEDPFITILRDFIRTCSGKVASTRDFIDMVEKHTGADWDWFFDQWVYGTDLPYYSWDHSVSEAADSEGAYELEINVTQDGVSPGFRMPIFFLVDYADGTAARLMLEMDQPEKTFTVQVPKKPARVTFNPNFEVFTQDRQVIREPAGL